MAESANKGVIPRLLEGKERSHDYKKSSRANGKPSLVWALVKGRFGRLVLINLLTLLFCAPVVGIIVWRSLAVGTQGIIGPYGAGLGVGYPSLPDVTGIYARTIFMNDLIYFALFIPAAFLAAAGVAGLAYVIGNLLRTEGIFVMKDYWRGMKQNYAGVAASFFLFSMLLFLAQSVNNLADWFAAVGEPGYEGLIASKVIGWFLLALFMPVCLWMVPLTNQYRMNAFALFRAAFVTAFRTFPLSVLFTAVATWPFFLALFTSGFVQILGDALVMILAFSYAALVFLAFASWVFERYGLEQIAASVPAEGKTQAKTKGPAPKGTAAATVAASEKKDDLHVFLAQGKSKLIGCPMRPLDDGAEVYELSASFSREDLEKLGQSKTTVQTEVREYEKEHAGEARYAEYNARFEEREKALGDGEKRKRVRPPKMLK